MEVFPPGAHKFFTWEDGDNIEQGRILGEGEGREQVPGALESFMDDEEVPAEVRDKLKRVIDWHTKGGAGELVEFKVAKSGAYHKAWLSFEYEDEDGEVRMHEPGNIVLEDWNNDEKDQEDL